MAGYRIPINITLLVNTEGMSNQLRTKGRFGSKTVIRDRQLSTHSGQLIPGSLSGPSIIQKWIYEREVAPR